MVAFSELKRRFECASTTPLREGTNLSAQASAINPSIRGTRLQVPDAPEYHRIKHFLDAFSWVQGEYWRQRNRHSGPNMLELSAGFTMLLSLLFLFFWRCHCLRFNGCCGLDLLGRRRGI